MLLMSILREIPYLNTKNEEIPMLKNTVSIITKTPQPYTAGSKSQHLHPELLSS